jgi:hypothetical protein
MISVPKSVYVPLSYVIGYTTRYAVGRWNHLPLSSILVFNAADIGSLAILRKITDVLIDHKKWKKSKSSIYGLILTMRCVSCLTGIYVATYFKKPISLKVAALTNLAGFVVTFYILPTFVNPHEHSR